MGGLQDDSHNPSTHKWWTARSVWYIFLLLLTYLGTVVVENPLYHTVVFCQELQSLLLDENVSDHVLKVHKLEQRKHIVLHLHEHNHSDIHSAIDIVSNNLCGCYKGRLFCAHSLSRWNDKNILEKGGGDVYGGKHQ